MERPRPGRRPGDHDGDRPPLRAHANAPGSTLGPRHQAPLGPHRPDNHHRAPRHCERLRRGGVTMKAAVYHGPGQKAWEEVPDPKLVTDTDAIVRIDSVTICGTDLHILKGDVPEMTRGRI